MQFKCENYYDRKKQTYKADYCNQRYYRSKLDSTCERSPLKKDTKMKH